MSVIKNSPPTLRLHHPRMLAVALAVAAVLIIAATGVWRLSVQHQRHQLHADTAHSLDALAGRVGDQLQGYLGAARILRSEWQRYGSGSAAQFLADAATIHRAFPGFRALNWVDAGGVIRWVYPQSANRAAENFDIRSNPRAWSVLRQARANGDLAVSGPLSLRQGGDGITVYLPLQHGGKPQGFINAVIDPGVLVQQVYDPQMRARYDLRISDGGDTLFSSGAALANPAYAVDSDLRVGARTWVLRLSPKSVEAVNDGLARWLYLAAIVLALVLAYLCYQMLITIDERRAVNSATHRVANYDRVTGLGNTFLLRSHLREELRAASAVAPVAVILINLGRFSLINSIYGFPSGDAVLRVMANRLITLIGLAECVFRSGSNEFAVVLAMPQSDHGEELIRRILTAISEPFEIRGISLQLPCAIGVAFAPGHGASADELLANAESALVQARGDEISASKVYSEELRTGTRTRLQLESRLRRAIENEELSLAYQPIIRVSDGFLVGFEALLRWTDAKLGVIPPATFIPIAERSGLIEPLGRWVLEIACSQAAEWGAEFDAPVQISVNLSPRQILDLGLPEQVERILENARLPAACLVLEITESLAMQNLDITVDLLNRLRQPGINIALDDFGTGYSSLSYLTRLPIYAIKLDREFIRHLGSSEQVAKTTKMIIQLAPTLGLMVVGEGVETVQQYALLREYGCDLIQGYLFSKPVAPDKARVLLRNRRYFPVPGESAVLDGVSA